MVVSVRESAEERSGPRLLFVGSDRFPPVRVDVRVLFGEELAQRGYSIDWILQSDAACGRSYEVEYSSGCAYVGPTDVGERLVNRVRKHLLGIRHDLRMLSLLRRGEYDILQVKDKFLSGIIALIAARWCRVRFVYWLSWPFPEEYLTRARDGTARYPLLYYVRGHVFRLLLYRVLIPAADHVFVQSEQMKRDIIAEGTASKKITSVPMGVSAAAVRTRGPEQGRIKIPQDCPCFLYLGTLARMRRIDFLVRVLHRLREKVPDIRLYIVGRGDDPRDEQAIVDEADRLGVRDAIVMVGHVPQQEAFEYVLDADVCVSPFYPTPILNSTSPTKLVEYMALGKPVVANDHPEQALVVGESGGGICVPYDVDAFADAVHRLLLNPQRERIGALGREYVLRNRTYAAIAEQVDQVLASLMSAERRIRR